MRRFDESHGTGRPWLLVRTLVLVVTLCAFAPAWRAEFVHWDDLALWTQAGHHATWTGSNIHWMLTTSFAGHWQPLTWLSYALDHWIWGDGAHGPHGTNVLLHAMTALLFAGLTHRLLAISMPGPGARSSFLPLILSAFAALFFAVHPLRVESVVWVAERRDVLSGCLAVWATIWYVDFATPDASSMGRSRNGRTRRQTWCYVGALSAFLAASTAKSSVVMLPLIFLLLDAYPLRRWGPDRGVGTGDARRGPTIRIITEKVSFFLVSLMVGLRALTAQQDVGAMRGLWVLGLQERIAIALNGLWFYPLKTVWPTRLSPLYELNAPDQVAGLPVILLAGATVVAVVVAWFLRRRFPAVPVALAAYAVLILPVSGVLQSGPQSVADRYSYLSCMSFTLLLAGGAGRVLEPGRNKVGPLRTRFGLGLLLLLVVVLVGATIRQARFWTTAEALWTHAVQVSPQSAIAQTNLADALARRGALEEAQSRYEKALELNESDSVAWHHLGNLVLLKGDRSGAIRCLTRSLRFDRSRESAAFLLARLLVDAGQPVLAFGVLEDVISQNLASPELMLYTIHLLASHPDSSVRDGARAVQLADLVARLLPSADPRANLAGAVALAGTGDLQHAEVSFRTLLNSGIGDEGLRTEAELRMKSLQTGKGFLLDANRPIDGQIARVIDLGPIPGSSQDHLDQSNR